MNSNNPITVDDKIYNKLTINLALSTNYLSNKDGDISLALRVVPTLVDNGEVKTADSEAKTFYIGSVSELKNKNEIDCVLSLVNSLQNFIANKGW